MPLHKPKCVAMYHQQLAYCVTQVRVRERGGCLGVCMGWAAGFGLVAPACQQVSVSSVSTQLA